MNICNITTVHKKGSKTDLKNQRGIFRVPVLRCILMRLVYNMKYWEIENNMSDCQTGARKGKSSKNNIFIVNGIIHDIMKSRNMKPVTLQIYDYAQMFDSIDLGQAISDIYDTGLKDDNLILINEANKNIEMAIKTNNGLTDRQTLTDIVLQGDTWGSMLASVQVETIGKECQERGYGYKYKDSLKISMLGMVDDLIGITEAGYQAKQMNMFINTKTAEKTLQFGPSKCKTMFVGKASSTVLNSDLYVDSWTVSYQDNRETGDLELLEVYNGPVIMEKTTSQKYLGFVLSCTGDNMVNIGHMKSKSVGIIRQIFNRLENLNLQKYYFECAIILMNCMLRSSILYAAETYYDLTEKQLRELERIEEGFLRKLLKTSKSCPIVILYLSVGIIPARFQIMKMRLMFLKDILNENEQSMIRKFYELQLQKPTKGDWASTCAENIKQLKINLSTEEMRQMKRNQFKNILKTKINELAFTYLIQKRGIKGKEVKYSSLRMADYLAPNSSGLTILEKQEMFAVINRMTNISYNFPQNKKIDICPCGQEETMVHIYYCKQLNIKEEILSYEKIFNGNIGEQVVIFRRFTENMKKRENLMSSHVIPHGDPPYMHLYGNGY